MRRDLEEMPGGQLAVFEVAQLVNLCPQDVDEAKALVPSLNMDREGGAVDSQQLAAVLDSFDTLEK